MTPRFLKNSTCFLKFSFSLLLLVCKARSVRRTAKMTKLERSTALDDNTCLTKDLLFSTEVLDLSMCAFMCMGEDTCQTLFYNQHNGKCHGCAARYTSTSLPSPSPGFVHFQKEQNSSCDEGWTKFQKSCYTLSPRGNFVNGVHYCETYSAHPVFVETSTENEFLKTFLTGDPANLAWYMGMTDSDSQGVWKYYNTNTLVQFLDFHFSEPDDNISNFQQCAVYISSVIGYDYFWGDHFCTEAFPTICEKAL